MKNRFNYYLILILTLVLTGCYSVRKTVENSKPNSEKINWPEAYGPDKAQFFVHNEIDIKASPATVWDILIMAESWPDWYEGAKDVQITNSDAQALKDNSIFEWKTMGQDFTSYVTEFDEPYRLSWESKKSSIQGYHAWLIVPTKDGCKLITSEAQFGFLTLMQKAFVPNKLRKLHDLWLAEIKQKAEK
ncbi:hypothetical protein BFP97_01100 [Roseivirga sp. 4D4]|uniref:SRPBCC domain-containing protein n=1 Tax=Roseivirga sp. 4D4 TaxID=1889784 RepID=UPI000853424E|nr:SRPBCC domain-containing protein [Roseivirga sp. 4D4]OEK00192.1 hypothetical protein BFP97_01100 [Roseivirga sp. 4D4]